MKPKELYQSTAWRYFSRYILLAYSQDGVVKCCTCGKMDFIHSPNMHTGHFIKVSDAYATAFEPKNVGPQCLRCNHFRHGEEAKMAEWIEKTHGAGTVEYLRIKSKNYCRLDKFTLTLLAKEFKKKFEELVKKKGHNPWKKR